MQYYDSTILQNQPDIINYFKSGIEDENKNISHCLLFWGSDITAQCQIALEIARLLNCREGGSIDCECLNCRWIREQTHPAVKIYTRLDFKESVGSDEEETNSGKKNINAAQARGIISELGISSDYHRVYIFCDRDEDGNLLPLNNTNFPEVTSNALLKTFEEPPANTTFIFLTNSKTDVISTVVSRAQSFFVPAAVLENNDCSLIQNLMNEYFPFNNKSQVLEFESELIELCSANFAKVIFTQMQNYISEILKTNFGNKTLFYNLLKNLEYIEIAKRQTELTPPMNLQVVCENLSFKLFLRG